MSRLRCSASRTGPRAGGRPRGAGRRPAVRRERDGVHLPRRRGAALRHAPGPHSRALRRRFRRPRRVRRSPRRASRACPTGSSRPARWPRTPGRARPRSASRRRPPTTATAPSAAATAATTSTSATSPRHGARRARGHRRRPARLRLQLRRRRQRLRARGGRAAHELGRRAAARDASPTSCSTRSSSARAAGSCRSGWPRRRRCGWRARSPLRTSIARSTGWRSAGQAPSSRSGARATCTSTAPGG